MQNIGLKLRMGLAAGVILFTYVLIMDVVMSFLFDGASLANLKWATILFIATCVGVTMTYIMGVSRLSQENIVSSDNFPELARRADRLADEMDIARPNIAVGKMGVPNAYAVGRQNKGYVVISTELLDTLTLDEVENIMAHEFAHLKNRDSIITTIGTTVTKILGWVAYITGIVVGYMTYTLVKIVKRILGEPYYSGFPTHQQAQIKLLADTARDFMTGFLTIFTRALSRQREYIADETAVTFTEKPGAMQSALKKISSTHSNSSSQNSDGSESQTSHTGAPDALCIHSEFGGAFEALFKTHPSMDSRISRIDKIASTDQSSSNTVENTRSDNRSTTSSGREYNTAYGTVVSGTTNGRASIQTELAADGAFHLSNISEDLSAGDKVRLYYATRDPTAADIKDIEIVRQNSTSKMAKGIGRVKSVNGTRIAVQSELADGGVFYLSNVQAEVSPGDRVHLYYPKTQSNPSAGDIKSVRPIANE